MTLEHRAQSALAPILRHPRSFCADRSAAEVHDYFSLNAQAHNSLYSGLHQQYKLGVPRPQRPLKLAPLEHPFTSQSCVNLRHLGKFGLKSSKTVPLAPPDDGPKEAAYVMVQDGNVIIDKDPLATGEAQAVEMKLEELDDVQKMFSRQDTDDHCAITNEMTKVSTELREKAGEMMSVKAKAKKGLLEAKRNGELETIAAEMESHALEKADEFKAIKLKAQEALVSAKRSGELEKIASEMERAETEMRQKADELKAIRVKAKKGLLDAKRKGELEKIADGMEKTSKNMVRQAGDISALKRKVAQGILAAHRDGELETMALEMHKTQHSVEKKAAELKELKLKVKKGLLDAHRTGGLETIAKGLEEEAERKAAEFRALKLKARRNLLEGKRDGCLEKLAVEMEKAEEELEAKAKQIRNLREEGSLKTGAQLEGLAEDLAQVGTKVERSADDLAKLKAKTKQGLLNAHRSGALEKMYADMESGRKEMAQRAERLRGIKAQCARGLIEAHRSGHLAVFAADMEKVLKEEARDLRLQEEKAKVAGNTKLANEYSKAQVSLKAKSDRLTELKKKAKKGEISEEEMSQVQEEIAELTTNFEDHAKKFSEAKAKAKNALP